MKKALMIMIILALFFVGCGNTTGSATVKKPISRTFEDLTLGMSEDEFRSKLTYFQIQPGRSYIVYSREYNKIYGNKMKEIENVNKVLCDFFNGKLYCMKIIYNSDYLPFWNAFIHNTKEKYGSGRENTIQKEISWDDKKTTLTIKEKFGQQFGESVSYYAVSYMDVQLGVEYLKKEQQSSPKF